MADKKREFLMTVDAEALYGRADSDHVNALVWGRFPGDDAEYGLQTMIREGDRFGVPFTFYLDFAGRYVYGAAIDEAARTIAGSGHDLQLHIHPELLPATFWSQRALIQPEGRRYNYSADHCRAVMETMVSDMTEVARQAPVAYRAGAFQVNCAWLDAAAGNGLQVSSNHCYASWVNQNRTPLAEPQAGVFQWSSGLIELPVTQITVEDQWRTLAAPMNLPQDPHFKATFNALADDVDGPPVVFLMHSWSLLQYSGEGKKFSGGSSRKVRRLARMLEQIADRFEPISTTEFARRAAVGRYGRTDVRDYPLRLETG